MTDEPADVSRTHRSHRLRWFLRENALVWGFDLLAVALWIVVASEAFLRFGWPRWTYYAVLFCGLVIYVQVSPGWTFPDQREP